MQTCTPEIEWLEDKIHEGLIQYHFPFQKLVSIFSGEPCAVHFLGAVTKNFTVVRVNICWGDTVDGSDILHHLRCTKPRK